MSITREDIRQLRALLLSLSACCEPCQVLSRPNRDKRRQTEVYLPAGSRQLLCILLDELDEFESGLGESGGGLADAENAASVPRGRRNADGHTPLQCLILIELRKSTKRLYMAAIARRLKRPDSGGLRRAVLGLVEMGDADEEGGAYGAVQREEEEAE